MPKFVKIITQQTDSDGLIQVHEDVEEDMAIDEVYYKDVTIDEVSAK